MSREKQIDDIRKIIANCDNVPSNVCRFKPCSLCKAERLYNAGYRKQSEGEWVERIEPLTWCEDDVDVYYECSCCGTQSHGQSPYCPNCGAKMKGDKWK